MRPPGRAGTRDRSGHFLVMDFTLGGRRVSVKAGEIPESRPFSQLSPTILRAIELKARIGGASAQGERGKSTR